jgi:hypothetical protein
MNETIRSHRETALDSPYSRDREDAIEELARTFPETGPEGKREVLETLRQVALEATSTAERELAREKLLACVDADPDAAADVAVDAFGELARDARFTDAQLDAVDALRRVSREAQAEHVEDVEATLSDLASDATSESVRKRARRRLTDVESARDDGQDDGGAGDDYLAASLAEHLENAAAESPEACRNRADELAEYVAEHPVEDEAYENVREGLESLVEQLRVAPTGDELGTERRERVERLADRTKRLYQRDG